MKAAAMKAAAMNAGIPRPDAGPACVATRLGEVQSARPSPLHVPSVLWCGFMIFVMRTSLQRRGFSRTTRWIRQRVEATREVASVDLDTIKTVERAVATAAALYPGRAQCLEQSLVLYYVLRRHGVAVRYCQGVQAHPFLGHAWVEYQGEPVNDITEHVRRFARLPGPLP